MSKNSKCCWHPGCYEKGTRCVIPWSDDDDLPYERYCPEHAVEYGYCCGCGLFCAGIDSFDFGRYRGLCDNCADEVRANEAWDDYEEMEFGLWEIDPYAAEY